MLLTIGAAPFDFDHTALDRKTHGLCAAQQRTVHARLIKLGDTFALLADQEHRVRVLRTHPVLARNKRAETLKPVHMTELDQLIQCPVHLEWRFKSVFAQAVE